MSDPSPEVGGSNSPCEKCGLRPHSWFTNEGYLCSVCDDERRQREKERRIRRCADALMAQMALWRSPQYGTELARSEYEEIAVIVLEAAHSDEGSDA